MIDNGHDQGACQGAHVEHHGGRIVTRLQKMLTAVLRDDPRRPLMIRELAYRLKRCAFASRRMHAKTRTRIQHPV